MSSLSLTSSFAVEGAFLRPKDRPCKLLKPGQLRPAVAPKGVQAAQFHAGGFAYWIATVTAGLEMPATVRTIGTLAPGGIPEGTVTFTWYKPANPGASPE